MCVARLCMSFYFKYSPNCVVISTDADNVLNGNTNSFSASSKSSALNVVAEMLKKLNVRFKEFKNIYFEIYWKIVTKLTKKYTTNLKKSLINIFELF